MSIEENSSLNPAGDPLENGTDEQPVSFGTDREEVVEFSDNAEKTVSLAEDLNNIDDIAQFGEWPDGAGVSVPFKQKEEPAAERPASEEPVKEDPENDAEKLQLEQEIILAAQAVKEEQTAAIEPAETTEAEESSEKTEEEKPEKITDEAESKQPGETSAEAAEQSPEETQAEKTEGTEEKQIEETSAEKGEEKPEQTEETAAGEKLDQNTEKGTSDQAAEETTAQVFVSPVKKKKKKPIFQNKKQRLLAILFFVLGFLLILAGVIMGVFRHLYGLSNYVDDIGSISYASLTSEATMNSEDEARVIEQITDTAGTISLETIDESVKEYEAESKATKSPWQTYENTIEEADPLPVANQEDGMYYLLLIGVDKHDDTWYGNSDAMIMVTINYHTRKIWLTSLMRDTAVNVPGIGVRKLNASYANGGAQLLIQTIESNFGIRTDNYAMVSFDAMKEVINAIGGIDLRLTKAEYNLLKKRKFKIVETDKKGIYHLWGSGVLSYSRIRQDEKSDFGRTQRHRNILMAIVNKIKSGEAGSLLTLANKLLPLVTHNIPREKVAGLLMDYSELLNFEITQMRIPYDGTFRMENEFLIPDYALTKEMFFDRVSN